MKPRKVTYLVHRWLGLVISLQLLAWSLGGFIFSVLHIEAVRGERDIGSPVFQPLAVEVIDGIPAAVSLDGDDSRVIGSISLADRGLGPRWEIRDVDGTLIGVTGTDGEPISMITPDEAGQVALRDFAPPATVESVTLIKESPPTEYRSGVMPAYRVDLMHDKRPHVYVDARSAEIHARRNDSWRVFDFFWMLHTMDYAGRDDFNHPLLTGFSILAILTALSGLGLWSWRAVSRWRRWRATSP